MGRFNEYLDKIPQESVSEKSQFNQFLEKNSSEKTEVSNFNRYLSSIKSESPAKPQATIGALPPLPEDEERKKAFFKAQEEGQERLAILTNRTTVFDQLAEGITGPITDLLGGVAKIVTGDPAWLNLHKDTLTHEYVPIEKLNKTQKAAFIGASALGYAGPGTVFNTGAKGLIKVGISKTGTAALVRQTQKTATKFIGTSVAKTPFLPLPILKQIVGQGASKIIKNGPALAIEGAAWMGIESGGDVGKAIEGAFLFPIAASGLHVTGKLIGPSLSQAGKYTVNQAIKYGEKAYKDMRLITANEVGGLKFSLKNLLPGKEPLKIDPGYIKQQKLMSSYYSAAEEASKEFRAARKRADAIDLEKDILYYQGKVNKAYDKIKSILDSGDENAKQWLPSQKKAIELFSKKVVDAQKKLEQAKAHPMYNEFTSLKVLGGKGSDAQKMDALKLRKFHEKTLAAGIDISNLQPRKFADFSQQIERWNHIEAQGGPPASQVFMELIEAGYGKSHYQQDLQKMGVDKTISQLKKLGVDGEKAWEWFHYVHKDKGPGGRIFFDGTEKVAGTRYAIPVPKLEGEEPTTQVKDLLFKLREATNWGREIIESTGQEIGYKSNYVGKKLAYHTKKDTTKVIIKAKRKAGLLKTRRFGMVPLEERGKYITDLYDLMPQIMNDSINTASYSNVVEKINATDWIFRASGHEQMADNFLELVNRAMGHAGKDETRKVMFDSMVKSNADWINKIGNLAEGLGGKNDAKLGRDIHRFVKEMMYSTYIGASALNPNLSRNIMTKQFFQPELVGAAEVGLRNVLHGKKDIFTKEGKAHLERVKRKLYSVKLDFDGMGDIQKNYLKGLSTLVGFPGNLGLKAFSYADKKNREIIFLAARRQFIKAIKKKNGGGVQNDLLPAERARIFEAFDKYGQREMIDEYALIRTRRANFAYGIANKPEIFSNSLGRLVPFTTWGTNQWERHIQNIDLVIQSKGRSGKMPLAKRLAYPIVGVMALQYLLNEKFYATELPVGSTTYQFPGALPVASMIGVVSPGGINPLTQYQGLGKFDILSILRVSSQFDKFIEKDKKARSDARFGGKKKRKLEWPITTKKNKSDKPKRFR